MFQESETDDEHVGEGFSLIQLVGRQIPGGTEEDELDFKGSVQIQKLR